MMLTNDDQLCPFQIRSQSSSYNPYCALRVISSSLVILILRYLVENLVAQKSKW